MPGIWARTVDSRKLVLLGDDGQWVYSTAEERDSAILAAPETPVPPVSADGDTHFRRSRWGDSMQSVLSEETNDPARSDSDFVVFESSIAGLDAMIVFNFVNDNLVRGQYRITQEHSHDLAYLTDRNTLLELLIRKYGSPASHNTNWLNDLYQDDPPEWGMAVSMGHLSMFTEWQTAETEVTLALFGDNFEVSLGVEYRSAQLSGLEDARNEQLALDDL